MSFTYLIVRQILWILLGFTPLLLHLYDYNDDFLQNLNKITQ